MLDNKRTVSRLIMLFFLIILFIASYIAKPDFFQVMIQLLLRGDIAGSIDFIRSFGPYAMLVSFFIVVLINIVAVLPNIFILAANGIIFGVVEGTVISWLAESVGVIISFIFMRYIFHDYAHQFILRSNALKRIDEFSGSSGFRIMLIARCIPYIPSGLITALGALSSISFKDYVLATLLGKLPSAWIEVTVGHDLASYHDHLLRLTLLVLISCLAYYLFINHNNRKKLP